MKSHVIAYVVILGIVLAAIAFLEYFSLRYISIPVLILALIALPFCLGKIFENSTTVQRSVFVVYRWLLYSGIMSLLPIAAKITSALSEEEGQLLKIVVESITKGDLLIISAVIVVTAIGNVFSVAGIVGSDVEIEIRDKQSVTTRPSRFQYHLAPMLLIALCICVAVFASMWYARVDTQEICKNPNATVVGSIILYIASILLGIGTSIYGEIKRW